MIIIIRIRTEILFILQRTQIPFRQGPQPDAQTGPTVSVNIAKELALTTEA
jgi:hypothetical protein